MASYAAQNHIDDEDYQKLAHKDVAFLTVETQTGTRHATGFLAEIEGHRIVLTAAECLYDEEAQCVVKHTEVSFGFIMASRFSNKIIRDFRHIYVPREYVQENISTNRRNRRTSTSRYGPNDEEFPLDLQSHGRNTSPIYGYIYLGSKSNVPKGKGFSLVHLNKSNIVQARELVLTGHENNGRSVPTRSVKLNNIQYNDQRETFTFDRSQIRDMLSGAPIYFGLAAGHFVVGIHVHGSMEPLWLTEDVMKSITEAVLAGLKDVVYLSAETEDDESLHGTGFLVKIEEKWIVLTAASCLYDSYTKGVVKQVEVLFGWKVGKKPTSLSATSENIYVPKDYSPNNTAENNLGFVYLTALHDDYSEHQGFCISCLDATQVAKTKDLVITGYPSEMPQDEYKKYHQSSVELTNIQCHPGRKRLTYKASTPETMNGAPLYFTSPTGNIAIGIHLNSEVGAVWFTDDEQTTLREAVLGLSARAIPKDESLLQRKQLNKDLTSENRKLHDEVKTLRHSLSQQKQLTNDNNQTFTLEKDELKKQITTLNNKHAQQNHTDFRQEYEDEMASLRNRLREQEEKNQDREKENESLSREDYSQKQLTDHNQELTPEDNDFKKQIAMLNNQLSQQKQLTDHNQELILENNDLKKQITMLNNQLSQQMFSLREQQEEKENMKQENERLHRENRSQATKMKSMVSTKTQRLPSLRYRLRDEQGEIRNLSKETKRLFTENKSLRTKIESIIRFQTRLLLNIENLKIKKTQLGDDKEKLTWKQKELLEEIAMFKSKLQRGHAELHRELELEDGLSSQSSTSRDEQGKTLELEKETGSMGIRMVSRVPTKIRLELTVKNKETHMKTAATKPLNDEDDRPQTLTRLTLYPKQYRVHKGPVMKLDKKRVIRLLDVVGEELELVNGSQKRIFDTNQFEKYRGTSSCSSITVPSPASTLSSQYWEANTRLRVRKRDLGFCPLLELGVCEEEEADKSYWVSDQTSFSWAVVVAVCKTHKPKCCTQVWRNGQQVGKCRTDTLVYKSSTEVRYGVVLDMKKGRLSFIDLDREIVLHKFDIDFSQAVIPMFGIRPWPEYCTVNMKLECGWDIKMTDKKKSLILEALS